MKHVLHTSDISFNGTIHHVSTPPCTDILDRIRIAERTIPDWYSFSMKVLKFIYDIVKCEIQKIDFVKRK